jgi:hypothetical protein
MIEADQVRLLNQNTCWQSDNDSLTASRRLMNLIIVGEILPFYINCITSFKLIDLNHLLTDCDHRVCLLLLYFQ